MTCCLLAFFECGLVHGDYGSGRADFEQGFSLASVASAGTRPQPMGGAPDSGAPNRRPRRLVRRRQMERNDPPYPRPPEVVAESPPPRPGRPRYPRPLQRQCPHAPGRRAIAVRPRQNDPGSILAGTPLPRPNKSWPTHKKPWQSRIKSWQSYI